MKVWIVVLKVFGYVWLASAVLPIIAGIAGTWMKGGFSAVRDLPSPFNIVNRVVSVINLAPGLGALAWAGDLKLKIRVTSQTI